MWNTQHYFRKLKNKYNFMLSIMFTHCLQNFVCHKKIRIRFDCLRFRIHSMHFDKDEEYGKCMRKFRTLCAMALIHYLFIKHTYFSFQIRTYQTSHIIVYIIYCVFAFLYIAYLYIVILLSVLSCCCHSVEL